MLRFPLIHPPLLAALGAAGHGGRVLLADANYSHGTNVSPAATLIHLNLRPGLVTVDQVLEPVLAAVPVESVAVMRPDDGAAPAVFARYREMLGDDLPLQPLGRMDFYARCREPGLAVCVATGDDRLYANVLLTIGYIAPAGG
ncbi:MAG TPA: RbsD/FucU domain-containing protein [Streptosporangiaceae bacterium]|nr:RbsD/FucU domain-containing protein [Streptosporangiaceae bacterium]